MSNLRRLIIAGGTSGLVYLLDDHLGSTSLTADGTSGAKLSELRYKPWGEVRYVWGATMTGYRYTGQRMEGTGLYDYGGGTRWYDSCIMQFNQPDTLIPDQYNSLDWNRYSYTRYNPLRYVDPSGHRPEGECEGGGGCNFTKEEKFLRDWYADRWSRNVKILRIQIGALKGTPPSLAGPYSPAPNDSTCFNCSAEPVLPDPAAGIAGLPTLLNTIGSTALNYMNAFGPDEIFLFLHNAEYMNGDVSADLLEINNSTNQGISIMGVDFVTSGSPLCNNCVAPHVGSYSVVSGPSISSGDSYIGLGAVGPNSTGYVDLTQPGEGNRPSNRFYSYQSVTIYVRVANTMTGQRWAPIIYPIR